MRRLLLVFVVMAVMLAVMAVPAFAQQERGCQGLLTANAQGAPKGNPQANPPSSSVLTIDCTAL